VLTSHDTPEQKIEKLSAYFTGLASQDEAVSLFATLLSIPSKASLI
jgi:hypothetical protein